MLYFQGRRRRHKASSAHNNTPSGKETWLFFAIVQVSKKCSGNPRKPVNVKGTSAYILYVEKRRNGRRRAGINTQYNLQYCSVVKCVVVNLLIYRNSLQNKNNVFTEKTGCSIYQCLAKIFPCLAKFSLWLAKISLFLQKVTVTLNEQKDLLI